MFDYGKIGVLYTSLYFALMASVRYRLYRDRLRIPEKWMNLLVFLFMLASGVLWLYTGGMPGVSFDIYRVVIACAMFAVSCLVIKAPLAEHAFSYAFLLAGNAALETTASYARSNLFSSGGEYAYPLVSALITAIVIVPAVRCLKRMISRISSLGSDRVWAWLDLACFSFLLMNLFITLPHPAQMSVFYPVGRYVMLIGMGGVYQASIRIIDAMRAAEDARVELQLTRRRIDMQESYYHRMIDQMNEVRRMRHDLRHHHAAIAAMIQSGDVQKLSAYVESAQSAEEMVPVTGNLAVDSVLLYYQDAAKRLNARMELKISFTGKSLVSDPDLCVIFGNLLENALEAQGYLPPEARYIRVTARSQNASFVLAVDNRFDGRITRAENGAFLSRKEGGGHGMGIGSVREVCEKYGGILQIDTRDDMFMAGVVIGI